MIDGIWSRADGESAKAYASFLTYLELGATRSLDAAWRKTGAKPAHGRASEWYRLRAQRNRWAERAQAWDRHVANEARAKELEEAKKQAGARVLAYRLMQSRGITVINRANLDELTAAEARKLIPAAVSMIDIANKGLRTESGEPEKVEITLKRQIVDEARKLADEFGVPVEEVIAMAERIARGKDTD